MSETKTVDDEPAGLYEQSRRVTTGRPTREVQSMNEYKATEGVLQGEKFHRKAFTLTDRAMADLHTCTMALRVSQSQCVRIALQKLAERLKREGSHASD